MDPAVAQLHQEREQRLRQNPQTSSRRSVLGIALPGGACVLAAIAVALLGGEFDVNAIALGSAIAVYVALILVTFEIGPIATSPVQIAFVVMWFTMPPTLLPLAVIIAELLGSLVASLWRRDTPRRTARAALYASGDAAYAFGPALVLAVAAAGPPTANDWWIYALALGAQFAIDYAFIRLRTTLAAVSRVPLTGYLWMWSIDAALAPIGLATALASQTAPAAALTVLPLAAILGQFAKERDQRILQAVELSSTYRGTAQLMGDVLEADDAYTGGEHTRGVVSMALELGRALGLNPRQMQTLEFGALLHDIGKLRVPNEIINKPGKLNDDEWAIIKQHPGFGQEMLDRVGGELSRAGRIVRAHHERWDGAGYPDGLRGEAIPIEARIITVCDSFSAMTTDRAYRKGMAHQEALDELIRCAGTQFDPTLVAHAHQLFASQEPLRVIGSRDPSLHQASTIHAA